MNYRVWPTDFTHTSAKVSGIPAVIDWHISQGLATQLQFLYLFSLLHLYEYDMTFFWISNKLQLLKLFFCCNIFQWQTRISSLNSKDIPIASKPFTPKFSVLTLNTAHHCIVVKFHSIIFELYIIKHKPKTEIDDNNSELEKISNFYPPSGFVSWNLWICSQWSCTITDGKDQVWLY